MTAWQPIESAPRDGSEILGWCGDGIGMAFVSFDSEFDAGEGTWRSRLSTEFCTTWEAIDDPLSWQPLPEPPSVEPVTRLFVPQATVAPREMPALGWDEALVTG